VLRINKYHAKYPPVHVMVAAYFGIGKKKLVNERDESGLSLLDQLPQG